MKHLIMLSFLFVIQGIYGQNWLAVTSRHDLQSIKTFHADKTLKPLRWADCERRYPIRQKGKEYYISLIAKVNEQFDRELFSEQGIRVGSEMNRIVTLRVPISRLDAFKKLKGIQYAEIAQRISANLDEAVKDVRADSVHRGINLPQSYTGKDVYIGVTDWGFDYTHPVFYDTTLSTNRIAGAWDQYKQSGPGPEGFDYGTLYEGNELLTAGSDTANIYSYALHGTHVAGIAGGSGGGTPYRGVAFESEFLFATFLIDAAAVMDAYAWMYQKAQKDGKRLVINQSWGLHHIGNLDGTSMLSQVIDSYSQLGVVFVTSGGNNGGVKFHLKHAFNNDEVKTRVTFYDYNFPTMWGQSITMWGDPGKHFKASMGVYSFSNELLAETGSFDTGILDHYVDSMLVIGSDTILFNISSEKANAQNGKPHMRFRVSNRNVAYKVILKISAPEGVVHAWNVVELTNEVGNWGLAFTKSATDEVAGNWDYAIGEPACTKSTIAVAAYSSGAALASFSSHGPTVDERMKPDIAAPGVSVASSISSYTDNDYTLLTTVDFNGRTYPFARLSGTSMAGPMVTGIVALLLEANPFLSSYQIKNILQETARVDSFTGAIPDTGSLTWGAGKVNAYAAIQMALQTIGDVSVSEKSQKEFSLYPNPAQEILHLEGNFNLDRVQAKIVDQTGRIQKYWINNNSLDLTPLVPGTYLLHFEFQGRVHQQRFVKE
ncbi:MAG: T9SS type A sorting domain-containing protein [Bacteroidetes bacterium]|nr:MAG: T9SS type A sorting domain-containing protein [Bacteroidota bacterium]